MQASTRIGAPAPDITLGTPDGKTISVASLKGRAVVLNFWASWCPPCRAEMAALNQVDRDYRARGVMVLGINQMESAPVAAAFMREQQLQFTVALDTDGQATRLYRVSALPTTYFIDKTGVIRDIIYGGPMTRPLIESKVTALLSH
ncbi:MAG: TlpA family protein disulfide reductase [Chloroflexi bacterium]|nr:TlpA family protein disulfide reductase [Chloroflexota bacterium]